MNASLAPSHAALRAQLVAALGADSVRDDANTLEFMSTDVYHGGGRAALVVRPTSVAALQAAVKACAAAGVAMVPRSGGASYTDGYLYPAGGHVLFDCGGLDQIEVDAANAVVTVGPGVTWAALRSKLMEVGLRTPFWGPFSGLVATVGGSVSQNAISHGSGAYGPSAPSVLGMDVVLANGEILSTAASTATRNYGPDLTGLFTGDCGVLGIKARIRLPLIARRTGFEPLSFAFDTFEAYHAAVRAISMEAIDEENFGLDLALSQGQIAKQEGVAAKAKVAKDLMRAAPSKLAGLKQLASMAVAGESAMRSGEWMHHFLVEGVDATDCAARVKRLREILGKHGREIPNSVPGFVHTLPFAPLTNVLGPKGERWVPLHGVLRHEDVVPFHYALQEFYAAREADMERLGVWTGGMFTAVGQAGFLYEIAMYWPDERHAFHANMLEQDFLAKQPNYPANPEARAYVEQLKKDLVALYQKFGAAHFQLGRNYPYRNRLEKNAGALIAAIKQQLDPRGLMNPGALGF